MEITLPNVQLSADQVKAALAPRLPNGTTLRKKTLFTDFVVRRSAAIGVAVKVQAGPAGTVVKLYGFAPSLMLRMVRRFVLTIFLSRKWRAMEQEVAGWLMAPAQRSATPAQPRPVTSVQPRPATGQARLPAAPAMPGQRRP